MLAKRPSRALLPPRPPSLLSMCYCTLASRARPDDARGHFATPCSYQRLVSPSSLLFSIYGHIRPKSALLHSYHIHAVRFNGSCLLPFESTSFLSIYHNSITNPSCCQELCLLYCAACQHLLLNYRTPSPRSTPPSLRLIMAFFLFRGRQDSAASTSFRR
jgi:hypothetical protein